MISIPFQSINRAHLVLAGLFFTSLLSFMLACSIGSVALSIAELSEATIDLARGESDNLNVTLLKLRLQRALSAFVTGATLALAGVLMQALLRNPLADPYVLGVSGGAAVGALLVMSICSAAWVIDVAAFAGSVVVAGLLFCFAYKDFKGSGSVEGSAPSLLLTGVIIGSGCAAIITLILSIAPDSKLRGMVFWLIGDLSATDVRFLPWIILVGALLIVCQLARAINVAALYSDNATTLGVPIGRVRKVLFLLAALLTASAVSNAGSIGFIGLIMPHVCRMAWGPDHRILLPTACLMGGSFLVLADTVARSVIAPQQLPVGVITALVGVPLFLLQLHYRREHHHAR